MSVIVCKVEEEKIILASDSQVTYGGSRRHIDHGHNKIFRVNEENGAGTSGYACGIYWVEKFFHGEMKYWNGSKSELFDKLKSVYLDISKYLKEDDTVDALMVVNGVPYYWSRSFIKEILNYEAIGDGAEFALGALFAGSDAETAVKAAIFNTTTCSGDIETLTFSKKSL